MELVIKVPPGRLNLVVLFSQLAVWAKDMGTDFGNRLLASDFGRF